MEKMSPNELAKAAAEKLDPASLETEEGRNAFEALWQKASDEEARAQDVPDEVTDVIVERWDTDPVQAIVEATEVGGTARPRALQTLARFILLREQPPESGQTPAA